MIKGGREDGKNPVSGVELVIGQRYYYTHG
jgi:hypothetical protein